ncbi:DUF1631 family protein [Aquabacterium sp.]|uniref:DUF1631 family protein n=1 Tax=Aquabacterium sp. TaxID=1872578 RepID=UPI0025BF3FAA|nr:DUF1631 family protein [Aquabacterium sp.]
MHDGLLVKKHLDAMLVGGPLVAQQVIDATVQRLRDSDATMALAADRQQLFGVLEALQIQPLALITAFGRDIKAEIELASQVQVNPVRVPARPFRLEDLTLMDEDQAEKDIEISRTIQLIDLKAEWELRELQALNATLLGETVLRLEANPCRPMVYARALSRTAHGIKVSRAGRGLFLRTAGFAMADVLRDVYGDACRRLKSWGVQPLEFRSAPIVRAGTAPEVDLTQPDALLNLRDSLPKQLSTGGLVQQQTVELLSRLFGQILADPRLESTVKDVIGRLQASVVRVALSDPTLMSAHNHPAWSLINQIAAHASDHPRFSDSRGSAFMEFVEPLIERLAGNANPSAALYEGALSDVQAFIDSEDEAQLQQSQAAVKALAEAEQRQTLMPLLRQQVMHQLQSAELSETMRRFLAGAWVEVMVGTVDELRWSLERPTSEPKRDEVLGDDREQVSDSWAQDTSVGALPTVPMALGGSDEDRRVKAAAQRWLQTLTKGVRCKLFLQGQWVTAHLLWRSDNGEFFMLSSSLAGGMHSMTRRALERLRIEGLATTFVELSLMQRAVDSVLQDLDEA